VKGPAPLALPTSACAAIADEVRRYGQQALETGGFLLAPQSTLSVSVVAFAGEAGIVRRWNLFQIHELALDRLFTFAADQGLWVPAQFHSHMFGPGLSRTDREDGLCVEEFVSVVVPEFEAPSSDPSGWGWWEYRRGGWHGIPAATEVRDHVEIVEFDREGVRAR
jgi:hypothetical protein